MPYHDCPAKGCTKKVRREELACPSHWVKLPWRMRTNLTEAWRLNDLGAHQVALKAALDWYDTHDVDTAPESRGGYTTTSLDTGGEQ
jgi:hypothetical protein